ncbi:MULTISPECIES: hypothetical protein [Fictibacillus]|uniref:hypothetical protein n=1 Tax=Fictibacillus TaxID=1329200 RepID=UPI0010D88C01|nr:MULTISPECIES: hypothetical protein [Fictibacillus]RZT23616.1 hypothetical protein EV282_2709 [Fictibacillus sp. BK138]
MLTMTNHEQLTSKPLDLPVPRYVVKLVEKPITEQEKQKPELELTPLNPKCR